MPGGTETEKLGQTWSTLFTFGLEMY